MPRPAKITNEAILAVARQVFLEQGINASTLTIAERAGISEASIFKRFTTKQALFLAAMGISETPTWVKALAQRTPTAAIKAELTEICTEMLAFYQETLPRVLMTIAPGNLSEPPRVPPPPIRDSRLLAAFLERAIAQGYLRPCDPLIVAQMIGGAITVHILTHHLTHRLPLPSPLPALPPIDPDRFVHNLIETLWEGIVPIDLSP